MSDDFNLLNQAKHRMITDIIHFVNSNFKGAGTILILDEISANLITTFLTMADLTESGIVVVDNIEKQRKDYPAFRAIYFIFPSQANFDQIEVDFNGENPKYASLHIFLTKKISNEQLNYLRSMSFIKKAKTMKEVNMHVKLFNDHLFELYGKENPDEEHVDALVSIISHIPNIDSIEVFKLVNPIYKESSVLYKALEYRIKDLLPYISKEGRNNLRVFLFDRSLDLVTPLTHNFHYECLLTDLLDDFKLSQTSPDFVYKKYRHKFIKDCILGIGSDFEKFLNEHPIAKIQRNKDKDVDINEMGVVVRGMTEYNEYIKVYETHMEYIKRLNYEVGQREIKDIADLEYTIITGVDDYGEAIPTASRFDSGQKYLDKLNGNKDEQLRLLMVLHGALYKDLSSRLTTLEDEQLRSCFDKYIQLVARYGKYWPEKDKENLKKMTKEKYHKVESSLQRYICKTAFLVTNCLVNGKRAEQFNSFKYGETSITTDKQTKTLFKGKLNIGPAKDKGKNFVIIYVVGGISFSEIEALKNLESSLGSDWVFILGGDKIMNAKAYIDWVSITSV